MNENILEDFFEHIGLNQYSEEDYLEHYGKKGMRWGVRSRKMPYVKEPVYSRSPLAKATIAAAAIGAGMIGKEASARLVGSKAGSSPFAEIVGGASAILGARAARTLVDKHANVNAKELKLKGAKLGDKKLTRGEKEYALYIGLGAVSLMGLNLMKIKMGLPLT